MSFQMINPNNFIIKNKMKNTEQLLSFFLSKLNLQNNVKFQDIINKHGVQLCQKSNFKKQRQNNKVIGGISESCLGSSIKNVNHSIDS